MVNEYSARSSTARPWLLAGVLGVALTATAIPAVRHLREQPPAPPPPVRATWAAPADLVVGSGTDYPFGLALSPDGRRVAFAAARAGHVQLWLQDLSSGTVTPLPGTDRAALPSWSADGTRLGFFADGALKVFALAGARVGDLAAVERPRGATWNARGELVFTNDEGGLSLASPDAQGAQSKAPPRALTALDKAAGEIAHLFPVFVPGGTHVVTFVRAEPAARQGLYLVALADGARARLMGSASSGIPAGSHLLYANDGALVAQTLDLAAGRLSGRAEVLGVRVGQSQLGQLLASAAGDVLVFSEPVTLQHQLVWHSREGERLGTLGSPADVWNVRIAPDGRRVAVTILEPLLRTLDVVQYDGRSLMPSRISLSIDADDWPSWSPDGLRVAWVQAGRAVMVRGAGAVLPAETVTRFDEPVRVTDWTPDGTAVLVARTLAETREDLWVVPVRGGGAPRPLVATPFADVQGDVSPDGRWVAYASDESGQFEVYVDRMDRSPEPGTRERVSSGGGSDPRWSRDGQELFFRRGSEIHVATPALGRGQNAVAATSMLFKTQVPVRGFDVAPDGQRFLLSLPVATPAPPATLIINWAQPKVTTTGP
jgi:Tol biopolymer transport system component